MRLAEEFREYEMMWEATEIKTIPNRILNEFCRHLEHRLDWVEVDFTRENNGGVTVDFDVESSEIDITDKNKMAELVKLAEELYSIKLDYSIEPKNILKAHLSRC